MYAIEQYVEDQGITSENVFLERTSDGSTRWTVHLTKNGVTESFPYWQGSAHKEEPKTHDVVWCLGQDALSTEGYSMGEWADEMGYDSFAKAEDTWKKIQENTQKLRNLGIDLEELWAVSEDY